MNKSNIIFGLIGTAAGVAGTWTFACRYFSKQMDDIINQEIEDIKGYYSTKYSKDKKEEEKPAEEVKVEEAPKKKAGRPKKVKEPLNEYEEVIDKLQYNTISEKTKGKKPKLISIDEWNTDAKYDKRILSYFPDDEIIIDSETEEVIDNVNQTLGMNNLETLGLDDDTNEIYIRNEKLGCDYQVILESGSYADFLSGDF